MKKARFSEEQMVEILREADRSAVAEVARKRGITQQTLYNWRKHFGGLAPVDVKRLRQVEAENVRLEKLVAERDLEIEVGFKSPLDQRDCRKRVCIARSGNTRAVITSDYWPEDELRHFWTWHTILETLVVGDYFDDPATGRRREQRG